MKKMPFPFMLPLLSVSITFCDSPLATKYSPILYKEEYNHIIDHTDVNRGAFRMHALDKGVYFALSNDIQCITGEPMTLDKILKEEFIMVKAPFSRVIYFVGKMDTIMFAFDLIEKEGVVALWVEPCD